MAMCTYERTNHEKLVFAGQAHRYPQPEEKRSVSFVIVLVMQIGWW